MLEWTLERRGGCPQGDKWQSGKASRRRRFLNCTSKDESSFPGRYSGVRKQPGVAFVPFALTVPLRLAKGSGVRLDRQLPELSMGDPEPRQHFPLPPPPAYMLCLFLLFTLPTLSIVRLPDPPSSPHPCLPCSLLERSRPPENVFLPCLSLSAKFSTLSAAPKLALRSKVNVPGSSSPFSTSNKRLELTPQSPRTARPLGFQLGWASVRNEEWARPKFGDVSWKLEAANPGLPTLCVSHSSAWSNWAVSGRRSKACPPPPLSRSDPRQEVRAAKPPSLQKEFSQSLLCARLPGKRQSSQHFCDAGAIASVGKARIRRVREWNSAYGHTRKR